MQSISTANRPIAWPAVGRDALARGGGELIEIAMTEVAATYAALPTIADESHVPSLPPKPLAAAHDLGADNQTVADCSRQGVAPRADHHTRCPTARWSMFASADSSGADSSLQFGRL